MKGRPQSYAQWSSWADDSEFCYDLARKMTTRIHNALKRYGIEGGLDELRVDQGTNKRFGAGREEFANILGDMIEGYSGNQ